MTDDDRALALARQIAQCATCLGRGSYPRRKTWETYEYVLETVTCHWCNGTGAENPAALAQRALEAEAIGFSRWYA